METALKDFYLNLYQDIDFKEYIEVYDGFTSRVIQHEYDHLEGILFVDYLNPLKKRILKSKLIAISKGKVTPKYRIKIPGYHSAIIKPVFLNILIRLEKFRMTIQTFDCRLT